jgi:hypothetical protein
MDMCFALHRALTQLAHRFGLRSSHQLSLLSEWFTGTPLKSYGVSCGSLA